MTKHCCHFAVISIILGGKHGGQVQKRPCYNCSSTSAIGVEMSRRMMGAAPSTWAGAAARIYNWGARYVTRCRRQCIEVCSADQSARSAEIYFCLHFSAIRMGSRGTFVLLHCKFQMYEDCRSRGRRVSFLLKFRSRT